MTTAVDALRQMENTIRSNVWSRWMAAAQRRALIWWRNRRAPPGVAARFTVSGAAYYGFGARRFNPYRIKPYYQVTGSLERMLLARLPRTSRSTGTVESRLSFGGGSLNFLTTPQQRPVVGWTQVTRTWQITVQGYTRKGFMKQGLFRNRPNTVPNHTTSRTVTKRVPVRGGNTYADAFGSFTKDRPAIEARVAIELRKIVRVSAYTKKGGIRSSVLRRDEEQTA